MDAQKAQEAMELEQRAAETQAAADRPCWEALPPSAGYEPSIPSPSDHGSLPAGEEDLDILDDDH